MNTTSELRLREERDVRAKHAVRAACAGFFVDMFDVYLPVAVLAPALGYFVPPSMSGASRATIFFVVFAVTLFGRPIGAAIFGHLGDEMGRRKVTLISVAGFSVVTLLIALLPGFESWGFGALVLLLLLRFLDGIFIGGEYTAANPLAMEWSPKEKRGLYAALIHIGYPGALLVTSLIAGGMLALMSSGSPTSAYSVWGWRIPFIFGSVISAALFVYYHRLVPESELWGSSRKERKGGSSLGKLFRGAELRRMAQLLIVMSGAWFTAYATLGALPEIVHTVLEVPGNGVNTGLLVAAAIGVLTFPFMGMLSQKIGRRPTIMFLGTLNIFPACLLYYLLIAGGYRQPTTLLGLVIALEFIPLLIWAVHTPYLVESFRTALRSSGYGITYSVATVVPGFYAFYMLGLGEIMPYQYTPIVLLGIGGVLLTLGAFIGQETKDVDL